MFRRVRLSEDHKVLEVEEVTGFDMLEANGIQFFNDLFLAHFVEGFNGDGNIFLSIFELNEAPAWF